MLTFPQTLPLLSMAISSCVVYIVDDTKNNVDTTMLPSCSDYEASN